MLAGMHAAASSLIDADEPVQLLHRCVCSLLRLILLLLRLVHVECC